MIQEIITILIIAGALGYFAYSMYRTFVPKKGKAKVMGCPGCSSECNLHKG